MAVSLITINRNNTCKTVEKLTAITLRRLLFLPLNARHPCQSAQSPGGMATSRGGFVTASVVGAGLDGKGPRV